MIEHTDHPLVFNAQIGSDKYKNATLPAQKICPFCHTETLIDIIRREGNKIWLQNKYPTIEKANMTVIIESEKHEGDISTYEREENREIFKFAFDSWKEMIDSGKYSSVLMFKNFGPWSGRTLAHPHLQIVGLEEVDGYEHISPEHFQGLEIKSNGVEITISTRPIMGFVEFNVIISDRQDIDAMADRVHELTHYLLTDYMGGRCDSYNLFFHHFNGQYICKIVPRYVTSPYFIGYKIPQVNKSDRLEEIAEEVKARLKKNTD